MKKTVLWIAAIALLFAPATLFAASSAWSVGSPDVPGMKLTGSEIVANAEGTILKLESPPRAPKNLALVLKTESGKINVWLGPKDFVEKQQLKLKVGDAIVVRGLQASKYTIASKITRGNEVMVLRSEDGQPAWVKK